ncbi:MAG: YncE family protein [Flavobacterium sp.]
MKINKWLSLALLMLVFFTSCSSEETTPSPYVPQGDFDSGVLVLNEGNFQQPNASISYISFDFSRTQNDIFFGVNPSTTLGDTAQSIGFNGNLAYIVVNGSDKIEIVNRYTMVKVGVITSGLQSPRYIAFANGKGYVTTWGSGVGDGRIQVINLGSNTVVSTITVNDYPNKIIEHAGKLYVSHNNLGEKGKTISVIDAVTNSVSSVIEVGDLPDTMKIEGDHLWVACLGISDYLTPTNNTSGSIVQINLTSNAIIQSLFPTNNTERIDYMDLYGNHIFYSKGSKIFKFALTETTLPETPAFTTDAVYVYGFAVKNNKIYVADAKTFNVNGEVKIYSSGEQFDPNPLGTLLKTVEVGVGPNGFYFNQ